MSEHELKIKVSEHEYAYGVYGHSDSKSVVIFIHGFPGSSEDGLLLNAARYFQKEGFSTYRLSLYAPLKDARQMKDCTIAINAQDIIKVIAYFKEHNYEHIYLVGHSFGCLPLLSHSFDCTSISCWEPTYALSFLDTNDDTLPPTPIFNGDNYILNWGTSLVVSKELVREVEIMDWDVLGKHSIATFIAYAENGILKEGAQHYFENALGNKEIAMIEDADHTFTQVGTQDILFTHTLQCFKRFGEA
jgi:hypothetical protein